MKVLWKLSLLYVKKRCFLLLLLLLIWLGPIIQTTEQKKKIHLHWNSLSTTTILILFFFVFVADFKFSFVHCRTIWTKQWPCQFLLLYIDECILDQSYIIWIICISCSGKIVHFSLDSWCNYLLIYIEKIEWICLSYLIMLLLIFDLNRNLVTVSFGRHFILFHHY